MHYLVAIAAVLYGYPLIFHIFGWLIYYRRWPYFAIAVALALDLGSYIYRFDYHYRTTVSSFVISNLFIELPNLIFALGLFMFFTEMVERFEGKLIRRPRSLIWVLIAISVFGLAIQMWGVGAKATAYRMKSDTGLATILRFTGHLMQQLGYLLFCTALFRFLRRAKKMVWVKGNKVPVVFFVISSFMPFTRTTFRMVELYVYGKNERYLNMFIWQTLEMVPMFLASILLVVGHPGEIVEKEVAKDEESREIVEGVSFSSDDENSLKEKKLGERVSSEEEKDGMSEESGCGDEKAEHEERQEDNQRVVNEKDLEAVLEEKVTLGKHERGL